MAQFKPEHRTVLVVDDDPDCRSVLKAVVETRGVHVLEACSGPRAVQLVKSGNPALHGAILDYNMPVMNGVNTLTALRQLRPGLKAILCSSSPESECLRGAKVDGMVFLAKPFSLASLGAALEQTLAPGPAGPGPKRKPRTEHRAKSPEV